MRMRVFFCTLRVWQEEHYSCLGVLVNTRVAWLNDRNDVRRVFPWQQKDLLGFVCREEGQEVLHVTSEEPLG